MGVLLVGMGAGCAGPGGGWVTEAEGRRQKADVGELSAAGSERGGAVDARVESEEAWEFSGRDGWVVRTRHYRIFTTETDAVLRERMAVFLEHALAHYTNDLAELPPPPMKLDVYLMDNRPQWVEVTRRLLGSRGDRIVGVPRGGFATRGIGVYYDLGLRDTMSVAAHESWHQYTQRTFGDRLPVWLEEGLAVWMEGHRWRGGVPVFEPWANTGRFDRLREVVSAGRLSSVGSLVEQSPGAHLTSGGPAGDGVLDFYAQVWALVHFLSAEPGRRASLERLVADAAAGRMWRVVAGERGSGAGVRGGVTRADAPGLGSAVLRAYFGPASELEAGWRRFCGRVTAPGGRDAIVSGRAPG